jgi:glycosyltransferase involved in cell wall biosynthesis
LTYFETEVELDVDLSEIGVVIPAYNAQQTVGDVIKGVVQHGFARENVIVINDGSRDATEEVAKNQGVTVVNHRKNMGKGAALRDGFAAARQQHLRKVFVIDADAQHRISEIASFMELNGEYDMVIGERKDIRSRMPFDRLLTNRTVNLVVSLLSGIRTTDVQCGFRYLDLKMFDKVNLRTNNYQTESEMVIKAARHNYRIGFVPVTTIYGDEKSYINPLIDTARFIKMAVRFLWR